MLDHFSPVIHIDNRFPRVTILDVTLRDGSFTVHFQWKQKSVEQIVASLAAAGIPYIELGYHKGLPELHNIQNAGITADVPLELIHKLATTYPKTSFALMVHPGSVKEQPDFVAIKQSGVSLVRFVYHHDWADTLQGFLLAAQNAGLATSVNLALSSRYRDKDALLKTCQYIAAWSPTIIYLADTCSAFYPHQVTEIIKELTERITLPVGFHAHDFLSLAFANSLAAAQAGASYIDVSLAGIGRGAGNLRAETWCTAALTQKASFYNIEALLSALTALEEYHDIPEPRPDMMSIVSGACNLTPPEEQLLRDFAHREELCSSLVACRYALRREQLPLLAQHTLKQII